MFGVLVGWLRLRGINTDSMSQLKDLKDRSIRPNSKDEVRMADLPLNEKPPSLPERFQGCVKRKRNGVFNVKRKCLGVLSSGILKLRCANEHIVKESKLSCEYVIELDKIHVYYNDRKRYIKLQFLKEAHIISPVPPKRGNGTKELFEAWKTAFLRHRHYRQGRVRLGQMSSGEAAPSSLLATAAAKTSARLLTTAKLATPPLQSPKPSSDAAALQLTQPSTKLLSDKPRTGRLLTSVDEETAVERTRQTEDLQRDIHELLGTLKRTHETIKHSLAHAHSDDEADSSSDGSDDDESNGTPSPAAQVSLLAGGHRSLEETKSKATTLLTMAVEQTAKTTPGKEPGPVIGLPPSIANIQSPPVTAKASDSILLDVFNVLLELKQVYDDLKTRICVKPTIEVSMAAGEKPASRLADTKVCAAVTPESLPASTSLNKTKTNGTTIRAVADFRNESPAVSPKQIVVARLKTKEAEEPIYSTVVKRTRRTRLPVPQIDLIEIPYSCVIKARLPIWAYEPLSALQVLCEDLRFATNLLGRAVAAPSAAQRMAYVAAFVLSGYATLAQHKQKPFNPLHGETFDYVSDAGWLFHAEQVSHHPPISAGNASHQDWEWHHCVKADARFTLSGVGELIYKFPLLLTLHRHKEFYTYNKVKTIVINPMKASSKRIIRQEGMLKIECTNGLECRLLFSNCAENTVKGGIYENRKLAYQLVGNWDKGLTRIAECGEQERLFDAPPTDHELADHYYGMTPFSVTLNELHADEIPFLPPTDSRFRPDQRFLETGEPLRATEAKQTLEKGQRKRESLVSNFQPLWFQPVTALSVSGPRPSGSWRCNGKYWESRALKFQDANSARMMRDIFKI